MGRQGAIGAAFHGILPAISGRRLARIGGAVQIPCVAGNMAE